MTFTNIGRTETRLLRDIAQRALEVAFAEHGVCVKGGNASFDGASASIKFEFTPRREDGTVETREARDWKSGANLFGFTPEDFGREFTYRGEIFTIAGLKFGAPRFPIMGRKSADGKVYKFPAEQVKRSLVPAS